MSQNKLCHALDEPLISVIVPVYQIERYIGICIESIINQTYKNLEIILVDDGSPDRCPEICDLYASKDSRIKVIHKANGGLVSARKAGLAASTGMYIGYVDGDDWIGIGFYEALYTAIAATGADVVCAGQSRDLFDQCVHFANNFPCGTYRGQNLKELKKNMVSYSEFYRTGISTYVWNKLFQRNALYEFQMEVDERITMGEDAAVTYPVLMSCESVCVTDNCAYHYRQREDSMLKKREAFECEAEKLRYLYEYMSRFAGKYDRFVEYGLQKQVDDYVLSICIMRSGGRLPGNAQNSFSTFDESYFGKKVILYSAGTFGQQLINRFGESRHCEVAGWVDDDYREYRRCCLDVDPVESVTKIDFDYILIATVDCHIAANVRNRLLDYGVSERKILSVNCPEDIRQTLLRKYLY